jgi:tetratricopeptide (TPR) repeat protein
MANWLRLLLMLFYSPLRGLREVRDRGAFVPTAFLALLTSSIFFLYATSVYPSPLLNSRRPMAVLALISQSGGFLVFIALVFSPLIIFLANLSERRASFRLVLQQEYAALTSALFYAFAGASVLSTFLAVVGHISRITPTLARNMLDTYVQQRAQTSPELLISIDSRLLTAESLAVALLFILLLGMFFVLSVFAIHIVLRFTFVRSIIVALLSGVLLFPISVVVMPIFSVILGSPFLLFILFLLLRGYFAEMANSHRARESFRQNLEAATLNPADASAHYNLGLIHQQRGEVDAARERFERAVQIDEDEIDSHYQLGRIAQQQNRLADAVRHFEQVVSRNPAHAQYEVWREVGATYLAANQFEDARASLEQFLEHRPSDPEGLYLMGRAHAGLGHPREAASLMEKCIEAVKTSPAYKYRASKRWLNEAQQFLRSQV